MLARMRGYMFRNRWFALLFVAVTAAGAASLVGTEDDGGTIADATDQITQQRAQFERDAAEIAAPSKPEPATEADPLLEQSYDDDVVIEFTSDEDLVLDPSGVDPTPVIEDPAEGEIIAIED